MKDVCLLACAHCGHAFAPEPDYELDQMPLCQRCNGALDIEEHELPQD